MECRDPQEEKGQAEDDPILNSLAGLARVREEDHVEDVGLHQDWEVNRDKDSDHPVGMMMGHNLDRMEGDQDLARVKGKVMDKDRDEDNEVAGDPEWGVQEVSKDREVRGQGVKDQGLEGAQGLEVKMLLFLRLRWHNRDDKCRI